MIYWHFHFGIPSCRVMKKKKLRLYKPSILLLICPRELMHILLYLCNFKRLETEGLCRHYSGDGNSNSNSKKGKVGWVLWFEGWRTSIIEWYKKTKNALLRFLIWIIISILPHFVCNYSFFVLILLRLSICILFKWLFPVQVFLSEMSEWNFAVVEVWEMLILNALVSHHYL